MSQSSWRYIGKEAAMANPLYGVGGWLLFFAIGGAFGLLSEMGKISNQAHEYGMTFWDLIGIDNPAAKFVRMTLILMIAKMAAIYWMMWVKHPNFRKYCTWMALLDWPLVALIGAFNTFPGLGEVLAQSFFSSLVSIAFWVTYLQRSKRVRVTFEHSIRVTDLISGSPPANEQTAIKPRMVETPPLPTAPTKAPSPVAHVEAQVMGDDVASEIDALNWEIALREVEQDAKVPSIWAQAYAQADGNVEKANATYIKMRAGQLKEKN